ncbi:MAG: hypothetical protein M3082_12700, partial [Candidatus Dormibacteraeota bacterium]|nr:hypothetical protein [Candidatus Dormibacteraeota bacterium]
MYDWTAILLSTWLIGGLFLDGWAHNHVASLETFFTPWHAVLYSGYAALAALYFVAALRNRGAGSAWQRVMPVGYQALPSSYGLRHGVDEVLISANRSKHVDRCDPSNQISIRCFPKARCAAPPQ